MSEPKDATGVALVTGAGSGMGAACARLLASRGYSVIGVDRTADVVAAALDGSAGVLALGADVADASAVDEAVRRGVEHFGRLDAAVNAAGVSQAAFVPTADLPLAEWRRVLSINLDGVFHSLRAEIPAMLASGGGAVVNVGSTMSLAASTSGIAAYAASKHGVLGLTRAAALEYGDKGIRVNAIGPGVVDTPMTGVWQDDKRAEQLAKHPIGRFGTPEEVAELVAFLLSPACGYLNGAHIPVDGGFGAQ